MHEPARARSPEARTVLLYSALALLAFGVQYASRRLDDNRLVSWQWVFSGTRPGVTAMLIAAGCVAAFFAARSSVPFRYPRSFLFLLSFCSGVLFWGAPEVIVDSARYFTQAKHLELYGIPFFFKHWGGSIPAWTDLPLIPFLYGAAFSVFGEARPVIQTLTTLFFSLTALATYLVGRTLWDEETGFSGGLLLLGIPYLFSQVPLMLVDVGTMCFFMLAVLAAIHALRRGGPVLLALAPLAIMLAALSKYSAWLLLSVLAVVAAVEAVSVSGHPERQSPGGPEPLSVPGMRRKQQGFTRALIIVAGTALLAGVVFLAFGDVMADQIRLLRDYQRPGLARWGESLVSTFLFQVHPLIAAAAIYSLWAAVRARDPRYAVICWSVLLLLVMRVERIRYLMMMFPMLALMAAYGLREVEARGLRRFIAFSVVAASLAVAAGAYLPFLKTVSTINLKRAGAYLDTVAGDVVEVYTLPDAGNTLNPAVYVPVLDLHTAKSIRYRSTGEKASPRDAVSVSPLRFTWELRDPDYYALPPSSVNEGTRVIAVISNSPDQRLPDELEKKVRELRMTRSFSMDEGVYLAKSFVTIYEKTASKGR